MKTRIYASFSLGLALSALSLLSGCAKPTTGQTSSLVGSANAEPPPVAISTNTPTENPAPPATKTEVVSAEVAEANVPEPAPAAAAEKPLPTSIKPTPPTAEVIRFAQAGVDEAVMLNYITNTRSLFVLSPDDIIYLNDLGVAGNLVTAMMHHDQGLKANWSNPVAPPPPAAEQAAAAPTYVSPPPAESQPPPQPQPQLQPEPAPVAVAPPPANVAYFNESLAPYGTWVEVEGYGRCWQPTVVVGNSGWRPYSDRGRWVYTDAGWYWLSDYSWGATTFHYGRWLSHPRWGWCWWPDNVWAPSWVNWRYSGDYCGWAPLPPAAYYHSGIGFSYYGSSVGVNFGFGLGASCFTFVSWGNFCDPHPYRHRIAPYQVTQIYNQTTIVNNYGNGRNNTVVNHGIPAERVREHTRTDLRPVRLREQNQADGSRPANRGERLESNGSSLVVSRPRIPESAAAKPLTAPPVSTETAREHGRQPGGPTGTPAQTVARTPTVPAGTARVPGRDGQTEVGRERNNRPGPAAQPPSSTTVTARTAPAAPLAAEVERTPAPSSIGNHQPATPSTATSPLGRPSRGVPSSAPVASPQDNPSVQRSARNPTANQPPSSTTVPARTAPAALSAAEAQRTPAPSSIGNHQPAAPSIATSPTGRPSRGVPSSAPSSSLVVIGKRDPNSNASNLGRPNPTASVPGSSSVTRSTTTPAPVASPQSNPSVQRPAQNTTTAAGGVIRNESPAPRVPPSPGYSPRPPQAYSAPPSTPVRPSQRTPTSESNRPQNPSGYSAPRTVTGPPTYSGPALTPAPRSTPSPSSTPRPSPAPAASAPAYAPRPAPSAPAPVPVPAVSAPRSAPVESRPAPASSSNPRSESGGRNRP